MKTRLEINSDILIWAVERAGFEVGEFSEKFPHLSAWLSGKKKPTLKQLKTFSQKTFYSTFSKKSIKKVGSRFASTKKI